MDPFYSILKKTKSPTAFGKEISLGGSRIQNDGIKKFSRTAKGSASNIAKRTRSNAVIVDDSVFIGGYTRKDGIVPLRGCSRSSCSGRKRKGIGGDGGNQWSSLDLGYGERKPKRGNSEPVIVLDGDESEQECSGRSGSSSENMENFDMGRQEGSGSLGVKNDNVVRTNTRQEEVNCVARRTRSKKQVQKGAVEKRVSINTDKTNTSCDAGDKNDDYVDEDLGVKKPHIEPSSFSTEEEDEDLGVKKSHIEPSSFSTEEEDEENNAVSKSSSSKNDNQSSTDDSGNDDDSEDEDFRIDEVDEDLGVKKPHIEPSSSSTEEEDEVDEDLGVKKSHIEPSSFSTEEEDEENNAVSKSSSSKNDNQSSTDDGGNDDDSEDEDFRIDESHGEPSNSFDVGEDEEGTSDSEISRKQTDVRKWQETFVGPRMTKFGCQNRTNIDSVPIVLDESQSSGDDIDDCRDEYYGNDSHIKETTSARRDVEEGKHNSGKSQIKRKRYSGLDILIPSDVEEDASRSVPSENCVARRTRSRKGSRLGNKQKKLGTLSHPICFDVEDNNCYTENDDDRTCSVDKSDSDSSIGETIARNATDDNINSHGGTQVEDGGKRKEDAGKSAKRKRVCAPKDVDHIFTALINSIWDKEEGEVLLENLTSKYQIPRQPIYPAVVETKLPLKFSFGIKKPVAEKSDFDKELDRLWAEFDFALNSSEIGSFGSSLVDDGDTNIPETVTNLSTLCSEGKHQLILDEDIGIRCRLCSFVKLELKYILPSWAKCSSGRSYQQTLSAKGDDSHMLDELDIQDNVGASQHSHIFAEGTVWDIIPGLRNRMYPHQREGFEFMWKNLAGGIELEMLNKSRSSDGVGGCVISHAPGTGKTLLTIVFLLTYMKVYPDCQPVIIAPTGVLPTWEEEFKKWKVDIPFHNLNNREISGKEIPVVLGLAQRYGSVNQKRMLKLYSWSTQMSILGISYHLFGELVGEGYAKGSKTGQRIQHDTLGKEIRKILLEKPGLLILDEGHTPRNHHTCMWKAVSKIETKKRIILSGTPFQNNFQELYNILCLVRPKFTDVIRSKGKWSSLTCSDDGLQKLRGMLDPFVHVHRGTILKDNLPGLRNWTIYLRPTPLQKELFDRVKGVQNTFEQEHQLALISVHPSLWMNIEDSAKNDLNRRPNEGVKIRFLMELIRLIKPTEERVLIFSQYLEPLRFIKKQLLSYFSWVEGKEVLQMDGEDKPYQKQSSINIFNDPETDARILLASTRACSEGIHLIGASRVVILDTVWNPSVEKQAISRAYRLGQKRFVYTYHLIAVGTKEEEQYAKQVKKEEISKLVFSSRRLHGERMNASSRVPDDNILREMYENIQLKDIFVEILSRE